MRTLLFSLLCLGLILPGQTSSGSDHGLKAGELQVEIGSDHQERRFYRPRFIFSFPLGRFQFNTDVSYYQQANSRSAGLVDYWVKLSLEKKLAEGLSVFLALNHFCRHQLLLETPYVFNVNEVSAGLKLNQGPASFALAAGNLVHGTYENKSILLGQVEFNHLLLPELSAQIELKLVSGLPLMYSYEAGLELSDDLEIFARLEKRYQLSTESFLGFRIRSGGRRSAPLVDKIGLANAFLIGHSEYKFESAGEFRLSFPARNGARLLASALIYSPFHKGEDFLGTFFPAELRYLLQLRYQRPLAGLQAGWFWYYDITGPFDREASLASEMSSGFFLANQDDFKRLERVFRFEVNAGLGFKNGLLAVIRTGLNTPPGKAGIIGLEAELHWRPDHLHWQLRLFSSGVRSFSLRPYLALSSPAQSQPVRKSQLRLALGLEWLTWE